MDIEGRGKVRKEEKKTTRLGWAIRIALVIFILLQIVSLLAPPARRPWIGPRLLAPVGGEQWEIGETKTIAWEIVIIPHHTGIFRRTRRGKKPHSVVIDLSRDGGESWKNLADLSHERTFAYSWKVTGPASADCVLNITSADSGLRYGSDRFEIVGPPPRPK